MELDLSKLRYLSSGADSDVYHWHYKNCLGVAEDFAIKLYFHNVSECSIKKDFLSLKKVNSPLCVRVLDVFKYKQRTAVKLEYVDGVTLETLIKSSYLNKSEIRYITARCVRGVKHLANMGVAHGDISLSNIMITKTGHVKLLDFGLGNIYDNKKTVEFTDQESSANGITDFLSDLYSVGRVMQFMAKKYNYSFNELGGLLAERSRRKFVKTHYGNCSDSLGKKVIEVQSYKNPQTQILAKRSKGSTPWFKKAIIYSLFLVLPNSVSSTAMAWISVVPQIWIEPLYINSQEVNIPLAKKRVRAGKVRVSWILKDRLTTKTLTLRAGEHMVLSDSFFKR